MTTLLVGGAGVYGRLYPMLCMVILSNPVCMADLSYAVCMVDSSNPVCMVVVSYAVCMVDLSNPV